MLFPIERLIEGRDPPVCVTLDASVREALSLMVEHDFSQLPVTNRDGILAGMISQETIAHRYFHLQGEVSLLDLKVDHCLTSATTLTPERDLLEVLDRLREVYAIVVVKEGRPIGILTDFDTTHFFRDLTEGLILVEDIEVTLRNYIEAAFTTDAALQSALVGAFGKDKSSANEPAKQFDMLTFGEHIHLITATGNWPRFQDVLGPMDLFAHLMAQVRQVRNQLAHFRGRPDPVQHDALLHARAWLESRPALRRPNEPSPARVYVKESILPPSREQGKYDPLRFWLDARRGEGESRLRLGFADIENLIQEQLPDAARVHRSWWANDTGSHVQSQAWLAAGWQVQDVDLQAGEVEFRQTNRSLMQVFFAEILRDLKLARPGVTRADRTQPQNWWSMSAGRSGFTVGWVFDGQRRLRVELYIDTGEKARNKRAFDVLYEERDEVKQAIGEDLVWERLESKRASRVFAFRPVLITDPPQNLTKAREWAVITTLRFLDAFQNRIARL